MFDMLTGQYKNLASKGRYGDTMLAHINPEEAALLKSMGGAGTVNPQTGLPEFYTDGRIPAPSTYQAPYGSYDMRGAPPPAPAPFDRKFADVNQYGMGVQQVTGYTLPSDQKFADIPLVTKYDPQGNFNYLTLEPGKYLTPDPSQPNIQSVPRLDASGNVVDWGIVDVNNLDDGSFGSMVKELGTEFAPMILAAIGANLLGPAAGAAGAAGGGGAAALSPYAAQAAGAYGGSSAAAAAAAAGSLTGIQAASAAQNALTAEALKGAGTTFGQGVTPTTPPTPSTPTPEAPPAPPEVPPAPTPPVVPPVAEASGAAAERAAAETLAKANIAEGLTTDAVTRAAAAGSGFPDLSSLGSVGSAILDFAKANPSIAGSLLGAVTAAVGSANAPKSTTTTSSIDPDIKAKYLAYLEDAKLASAGLLERKFAPTDPMYTTAETKLNTLGLTPFGAADIARFFNPYENQVVTGALADIENTRKIQEQENMARATAARAFGGSRQGVVSGMTNEAAMRQSANTAAQLRSAGYTQAANLGLTARPLDIAGLQTSLGLGTASTSLAQQKLDAARNLALEKLAVTGGALGLQPANVGGTTSQPLYSNTAGNLLSGGLTGAYIGSLLGKG